MREFYSKNTPISQTISVNKFYALFDVEWHRVRCFEVDSKSKTAKVFFIDRGDTDEVEWSNLLLLDPEFCQLPAQAIRLSLKGLENLQDWEGVQTLLDESLVEKQFCIKESSFISQDKYSMNLSVLLLTENSENVNSLIAKEIFRNLADPRSYMKLVSIFHSVNKDLKLHIH